MAVNDPKQPSILDTILNGGYDPLSGPNAPVPGPLRSIIAPAASPNTPDIPGPEAPGWAESHATAVPITPKGPTLGSQEQFTSPSEAAQSEPASGGSWSNDGKTLMLPPRTSENSLGPSEEQPSFLKKLARVAGGAFGLEDPSSSPQASLGAKISNLAGRVGVAGVLAAGTPSQREAVIQQEKIPLEMAQLQAQREWRQGMLGVNQQKANTGSQTEQDKYAAGDAAMGLPPGTSRMVALATAQNAASNEQLRHAQTKKIDAELQGMNWVDPNLAHALGRDDLADQMISPIAYQQQIGNVAKSRGFHQADLMKEGTWVLDNVGRKIYQITPESATLQRPAAYQGSKPVVDINPDTGAQQYDVASNATANHLLPGGATHQMLTVWQPALDSGERLQVMEANLERGLHGDQQAMLSLLANHLGMTMGLQKGARLNQAIIAEAEQSRPWLEGMKAKFDDRGYLTGVVLSPQQMKQMVDLGVQRYQSDVQKARYAAPFIGVNEEPMLPINPDTLANNPMPKPLPHSSGGGGTKLTPAQYLAQKKAGR